MKTEVTKKLFDQFETVASTEALFDEKSALIAPSVTSDIRSIIEQSRQSAIRVVDHQRVQMYWRVGERILNEELENKDRSDYGAFLIKTLAFELEPEFGTSFSARQLYRFIQFCRCFPIVSALRTQFSWTHYKLLLSIENNQKREFYELESAKELWTARQLERQINSQLYERLLLSNDAEAVLAVARNERIPTEPTEIIKDPMVLEFLGLKRESAYYEKDLEQSIISNLQEFLLELGSGFSFVARQKRIHLDGDDFFIDHRLSRNYYAGITGDEINVLLAASAMNFKRMMNKWKEHFFTRTRIISELCSRLRSTRSSTTTQRLSSQIQFHTYSNFTFRRRRVFKG